ncbi:TPA: tyrosine-type recombinase/integrase [Vibrio parahaemolyticus]
MIEQNESFPVDYGVDYCLMSIYTNKYPAYISRVNSDSGEFFYDSKNSLSRYIYKLPLLIAPNGINVVPANLYLHSLLSNPNVSSIKTIESHAGALLSFYRWMNLTIPKWFDEKRNRWIGGKEPLTIYDCTEKIEDSPVVKYRDYLLDNIYTVDENGKLGNSPNTASSYVLKIVAYFTFLQRQRIIQCGKKFRPFEFSSKIIHLNHRHKSQQDMLSHINGSPGSQITVYTTGLTKPFKNKQKPQNVNIRKLNPLHEDEKQAFYKYLDVESTTDTKALMLYLKTEAGLRLEELVTFPSSVVVMPKSKVVKVPIGENINGCLTKFRKERTIEIPSHVMALLYEYKLSKARKIAIEKGLLRHSHLFVKSNGSIYSPNTIEKYVEMIRNKLTADGLDIYFTSHDLRATFATDWLYEKHIETGKPMDALVSELADLMGHQDTSTTYKYIRYMNDQKVWSEFALRKNQFAKQTLR